MVSSYKRVERKPDKRVRKEVIQLLTIITPDYAAIVGEAVDILHQVGRWISSCHKKWSYSLLADLYGMRCGKDPRGQGCVKRPASDTDMLTRCELWPKIKQARKEGKTAGFQGPFGYIDGECITWLTVLTSSMCDHVRWRTDVTGHWNCTFLFILFCTTCWVVGNTILLH